MKKVHFRHTTLRVNAGMDFPACKAGERLLDLDAGRWPTTGDQDKVTCKHCLRYLKRRAW
jgi:hypothetical protein